MPLYMINNMVLGSTHLGEILSEVIVVGAQNKNVTSETISSKYRNNKYATIGSVVHKSFDSRFKFEIYTFFNCLS